MTMKCTLKNSPIPPLKEGIHLLFLGRIIQNFKQAVIKTLRICDGVRAGEYR
jgi:hypothetical protein